MQKYVHDLHVQLGHSHSGVELLNLVGRPKAAAALRAYQKECEVCRSRGRKPSIAGVRYDDRDLEAKPFQIISYDILVVNELPWSHLLHIVDHATRYSMMVPIESHTPEEVMKALFLKWILIFGKPEVIVCDRGPDLTQVTDLAKMFLGGTILLQVPSQAHGQNRVEAHNRVVRRYLELALVDNNFDTSLRAYQ